MRTLILNDSRPHERQDYPWLLAQRTVIATEPVIKKVAGLESAASIDAVGGCLLYGTSCYLLTIFIYIFTERILDIHTLHFIH